MLNYFYQKYNYVENYNYLLTKLNFHIIHNFKIIVKNQ